jgi:serine/threonine-protein kinase
LKRIFSNIPKFFTSRVFQGLLLGFVILVMLFLLVNNFVMPLYTRQGSELAVPELMGMTIDEADSALSARGFRMILEPAKFGTRVEPGTVLEQRPLANAFSKPGRKVRVVPAKEVGSNAVPYLIGLEVRDAQVRCRNLGLICGPTEISYQFSKMTPKGLVLEQVPAEGEEIEPGGSIQLVVSLGDAPDAIRVPLLTEKSLHDARQSIIEAGLELGRVTRKETDVYVAGTVIAQSVRSGLEVERGRRIDLVVAVPIPMNEQPPSNSD